jgi:hypothetical protein
VQEEVVTHEPYRVYLKTDLDGAAHRADARCHDAAAARGALAKHELRAELWHIILAIVSLGVGGGVAAIGGWLLILMLVHLLQALTALPLWACYGTVGGLCAVVGGVLLMLGKQKLARLHLVPQDTAETMQENVQWITAQVRRNGRSTQDRHP